MKGDVRKLVKILDNSGNDAKFKLTISIVSQIAADIVQIDLDGLPLELLDVVADYAA